MTDRERRIREAAYRVWEQEGGPDGQAERHWALAEQRIDAEDARTAGPAPESDDSAKRSPPATRIVRGKAGTLRPAPGVKSERAAPAESKSRDGASSPNDRRSAPRH